MEFDPTAPIWLQIVGEFSRRIAAGEWAPGERIPGVRELAGQLGVNPNTVQRSLSEMEREELCRSERTAGRFVTDDPRRIQQLRRSLVVEAAEEFIRTSHGLGLDVRDAVAVIDERWRDHEADNHDRSASEK